MPRGRPEVSAHCGPETPSASPRSSIGARNSVAATRKRHDIVSNCYNVDFTAHDRYLYPLVTTETFSRATETFGEPPSMAGSTEGPAEYINSQIFDNNLHTPTSRRQNGLAFTYM